MLDGGFIDVATIGELWSLGWRNGDYSHLIEVDVLKMVSAAPWAEVMQCYPLPLPPPPREHCVIPARVAAKEMMLIEVNSTNILFCNYFGTLFTRGQLCFSQQNKFWYWWKDVYYSFLFGGLRNIFCPKLGICYCQLIALFWNVIAKSTWHAQGSKQCCYTVKSRIHVPCH